MEPADVVLPIFDGQVSDYPFDRHQAFLELEMTTTTNPPIEVPLKVNLWSDIAGFNTTASPIPESTNLIRKFLRASTPLSPQKRLRSN